MNRQIVICGIWVLASMTACTSSTDAIECKINADCNLTGGGLCEVNAPTGNKWCSYEDSACDSGRRWSDLDVGDGVSGLCTSDEVDAAVPDGAVVGDTGVPEVDASFIDASFIDASLIDASPDAAVPDASVVDAGVPDANVPDATIPDAAAPDAAVCGGGSTCVAAAPAGWTGPGVFHTSAAGTAPPACPAGYPSVDQDLNANLVAGGSCDCSCGNPQGVTCGDATITQNTNTMCGGPDPMMVIAPNTCTTTTINPGFAHSELITAAVAGGICLPTTTDNLTTPTFQDAARACSGTPNGGGCLVDEVCAPAPTAPFQAGLCVWSAGDIACPAGSLYNQRSVHYNGSVDNRTCETCTCGVPAGSCGGSVQFTGTIDCSGSPGATLNAGACEDIATPGNNTAATYTPDPGNSSSCTPSAGTVLNSAAETNPVTVCCQP